MSSSCFSQRTARLWLRRLHDETGITSVFVTHDQEEALEVADRVAVLNHGRLEQVGIPDEVHRHPASPFVHHFLGQVNVFHSRHLGGNADEVLFVRPHELALSQSQDPEHSLAARIVSVHAAGHQVRVELAIAGTAKPLEAILTHEQAATLRLTADQDVYVGASQARTWDRSAVGSLIGDYAI